MIVYYSRSDIDWPIETHTLLNIDGIGQFLYRSQSGTAAPDCTLRHCIQHSRNTRGMWTFYTHQKLYLGSILYPHMYKVMVPEFTREYTIMIIHSWNRSILYTDRNLEPGSW